MLVDSGRLPFSGRTNNPGSIWVGGSSQEEESSQNYVSFRCADRLAICRNCLGRNIDRWRKGQRGWRGPIVQPFEVNRQAKQVQARTTRVTGSMSGISTESIATHPLIKERVRIVQLANPIEGVRSSLSQQLDVVAVECRHQWPERQERQQHQ